MEWLMKKAKELESLNLELHPSQRINLDTLTRFVFKFLHLHLLREEIKKQLLEKKKEEKQKKLQIRRKQLKEIIKSRKSPTETMKQELPPLPPPQPVYNKFELPNRRQSCTIRRPVCISFHACL